MSNHGMNIKSATNNPLQTPQMEEDLKKEQEEQKIVDQELHRKAERREENWKALFRVFLWVIPTISLAVGFNWKDISHFLRHKLASEDDSEWYYELQESRTDEALVSVDSVSANEQAEVETVTPATPTNSATRSNSTSHWSEYSYSDHYGYEDDDDDDDDDDTWYRGDDDPDEYWEYDYHE